MKNELKLEDYLYQIVTEITNTPPLPVVEVEENLEEKIFKFLSEMHIKDSFKLLEFENLVRNEFKKDLITEVVADMGDDEDYDSENINKKINESIKEYFNEWIKTKLSWDK
jgi:predicted nucleotidyltransferase component of viral defense system